MSSATFGAAVVALGAAAAVTAIAVVVLGLLGRRPGWWRDSRWLVGVMLVTATLSVIWMERALITRDFTIEFVAQHGSNQTPPVFNVATLWSALEGSILLWTFVLTGYVTAVVVKFREKKDDPMMAWVMLTKCSKNLEAMSS